MFFEGENLLEKGLYTLWMIWRNRNDCLHNLKCRNPVNLGWLSIKMAEEFKRNVVVQTNNRQRMLESWQPPPRGFLIRVKYA